MLVYSGCSDMILDGQITLYSGKIKNARDCIIYAAYKMSTYSVVNRYYNLFFSEQVYLWLDDAAKIFIFKNAQGVYEANRRRT